MAQESSTTLDRISGLSDFIIGDILSLLPTKKAVATSILSKRWRYLWTSLKNLDFRCWDYRQEATFVEFVDRVLSKCTTQELHKFELSVIWMDSYVHRWVNEAIKRNVQMLELDVPELQGSVFTCRSLTSLRVNDKVEVILNIPDSFHFPKLKNLFVSFKHDFISIVQKLISTCPALEDLTLYNVDIKSTLVISPPLLKRLDIVTYCLDVQSTLVISPTLLKKLYIRTWGFGSTIEGGKVVVDAPQLQFLDIASKSHVNYVVKNMASEVEAIINVGDDIWYVTDRETRLIVELLIQLSRVKSLTLETPTLRGLGKADPNMLPIFNKLSLLKLKMGSFYGCDIISNLLQASPSLEVFIVEIGSAVTMLEVHEFHWVEPQHVPPCLLACLRVVEFYIDWQIEAMQELKMMKYFLGNSEVLRKFAVKAPHAYVDVEFCKKLLQFPRASRYCEVQLSS